MGYKQLAICMDLGLKIRYTVCTICPNVYGHVKWENDIKQY